MYVNIKNIHTLKTTSLNKVLFKHKIWLNSYLGFFVQRKDIMPSALSTNLKEPFTSASVTRLGDLLDFGQLFKAFGKN